MSEQPTPSFPETADIETASEDYARRFAGRTGEWMLSLQERLVVEFARRAGGQSVLDVGGGHGQLAWPLRKAGFEITVLSSAPECVARLQPHVERGEICFVVGNVIEMPFESKAFDLVVSVRLLTHCERWPKLVAEMCRVARRAVIVDYPALQGFNALSGYFFSAKKQVEKNTRTWRDFRHEEVDQTFGAAGWRLAERAGQFFWPMVLHRLLRCVPASRALEWPFHAMGLTRRWGSPVIAMYVPPTS